MHTVLELSQCHLDHQTQRYRRLHDHISKGQIILDVGEGRGGGGVVRYLTGRLEVLAASGASASAKISGRGVGARDAAVAWRMRCPGLLRGPPEAVLRRTLLLGDASMGSRSRFLLPSSGTSALAHKLLNCIGMDPCELV